MRSALLLGVAVMMSSMPAAADEAANPKVTLVDDRTVGLPTIPGFITKETGYVPYPQTKTVDVVEEQFSVKVADPYRWLEDDVRVSSAVADWVKAQNAVSNAYLETLPGKDVLAARMKKLYDYERFGLP